jgi:hypothetical protein|uniref:Uncharacterized protein n=1 Tax=viral metagenome TaxID=1070528 RepID=A0A6C0J537_9ZZZZ
MSKDPNLTGFSNSQLRKLHGNGEYQRRLKGFNNTVDKTVMQKQMKELDAKERYRLKMKSMRNNRCGSDYEELKEEVKNKVEETKEEKSFLKTKSENKKHSEKMRKLNKKYGNIILNEYTELKNKIDNFKEEQKNKKEKTFLSEIYKCMDDHYADVNKVNLYEWQQSHLGISVEEANKAVLGDIDEDELSDLSD